MAHTGEVLAADAGFQTQVLVSLAEIKGSVQLMNERHQRTEDRFAEHQVDINEVRDRHDKDVDSLRTEIASNRKDISQLFSAQARTVGIAVTLAVVLPIIISVLGLFMKF